MKKKKLPSVAWKIVWIDQGPKRREAVTDCKFLIDRLNHLRQKWHHFERKDKPAFIRWRAREFGALLSEAREIEQHIREAQELIHEVEVELRRFFQTPQSAYARVMSRRGNPGKAEPAREVSGGGKRALTEFEQEALFQEWVRKFLGTNPDKMDDAAYDSSFALFKTHMFTRASAPEPPRQDVRQNLRPKEEPEIEEAAEAAIDERVRVLYRRLARQLHPDARADGSTDVSHLWHEVQEAYAASDVARMELLLALSHLQGDSLGGENSVSDLMLVQQELRRSLQALTKSVREAENEDAWDFAQRGPTTPLALEIERQLKFDLSQRTRYLEQLRAALAQWQD